MEYEANPNSRFPLPVKVPFVETSSSNSNWFKPAGMTIHPFSGSNSLFDSPSSSTSTASTAASTTSSSSTEAVTSGDFSFGSFRTSQPSIVPPIPTSPRRENPISPLFGSSRLTPSLFGKAPVFSSTSPTGGFSKFNTLPNSFGGILSQPEANLAVPSQRVLFGSPKDDSQISPEKAKVSSRNFFFSYSEIILLRFS